MRLGEYEITTIQTGNFRLDGGAMFGVVPRVLWEKTNPPDEKNRILMALRALVVRGKDRCLLVDSGIGSKWSPKLKDIYAIDYDEDNFDKLLAEKGLTREAITDVVITHLHFDHVGGSTRLVDGRAVLSFPNATFYIQEENLKHAHAPSEKDRASFLDFTIQPLLDSGKLKTIRGNFEFMPGVSAWVTQGHTPSQQLVKVSRDGKTFLFAGDTIPTASHIPLPYVMAYDLFPMTTLEEKKVILQKAVEEGWVLVFSHDPNTAACLVEKDDQGRYSRGREITL